MKKLIAWIFAKIVEPKIKVRFCHDGNSYDSYEEAIYLDLDDTEDFGFLRHLEEKHGFSGARLYSLNVWSILHEIGHYNTLDYCEENSYDELLARGMCGLIAKSEVTEEVENIYFGIESEWEATEWAIIYVMEHRKLCRVFSGLLR